ncbi:RNA polymerase sigma factor [Camelimonas fluminis]|nr:RNA polymerase sigma factor [Camelimonas fluminis]GHE68660.1 RNA polymerase sigma factor [Camelimonas fluminis]
MAFRHSALIMQGYNQRLYRIARSIIPNDSEAEDIVQEAYVDAFAHLDGFRGQSSLATWLSRIVINEALGRLRKKRVAMERLQTGEHNADAEIIEFPRNADQVDPERAMAQRQILRLVEQATDNLPVVYRTVFIARVIEGLSVSETAELPGVPPGIVKTRLHSARSLARQALEAKIGPVLPDAFPFAGKRCERLTAAVAQRPGLHV